MKLFRRDRRGVSFTEARVIYSRKVASRPDEVERNTLELMAKGGHGGSRELAVVPTLATKWLLPRVPVSNDKYPNITVKLTVHTRPFLFDDTEFDAAVHAGAAIWPGTEGTFLMREN